MKRCDLIRHLERHGCEFFREGRSHTLYVNRGERTDPVAIPRHNEVNDILVLGICRDLKIPRPGGH